MKLELEIIFRESYLEDNDDVHSVNVTFGGIELYKYDISIHKDNINSFAYDLALAIIDKGKFLLESDFISIADSHTYLEPF